MQTDTAKLQRVLLNLLSNAFKFTPNGGRVRVSLSQSKDRFRVEVGDSGPGVPPEKRVAVFERFQRFDHGRGGWQAGAGLGLSIVKDFTALLAGTVSIGDAPEGGALFVLDSPSVAPAGMPVKPESQQSDGQTIGGLVDRASASFSCGSDGNRARGLRPACVAGRGQSGHEPVSRRQPAGRGVPRRDGIDGHEGYEKAIALHPDLVVTDIMMPRMSGDELIRSLRQRPDLRGLPIVALTAQADPESRLELLRGGADDSHLDKPFSAKELCARVHNLATRIRSQHQADVTGRRGLCPRGPDT